MLESTGNVVPTSFSIRWSFVDVVLAVHTPQFLVTHVQLLEQAIDLFKGSVAWAVTFEDAVVSSNTIYVVDRGGDMFQQGCTATDMSKQAVGRNTEREKEDGEREE